MRDLRTGAALLLADLAVDADLVATGRRAVAEGADILWLAAPPEPQDDGQRLAAAVAELRRDLPEVGIGVPASAGEAARAGADLVWLDADHLDPASLAFAAERAAVVACAVDRPDPDEAAAVAARLAAAGVPADRVALALPAAAGLATAGGLAGGVEKLAGAGWPTLVDPAAHASAAPAPAEAPAAGLIAATAVCAWLGARIVRVSEVELIGEIRQTLDMVASIRGDRPPGVARRALA